MEIRYFNRHTGMEEVEKVYGDAAVKWMYESTLGKLASNVLTSAPFSQIYGGFQDTSFSRKKVLPFIEKFQIQMDDYEIENGRSEEDPYSSFNNFFIRKFKPGKRDFASEAEIMPAFSEARYFGYEQIEKDLKIPVKGKYLRPESLIEKKEWQDTFKNGPLLLARLCPVDYHRFHYPDDGKVLDNYRIHGQLHSVNPLALKKKPDILIKNEREVTILETKNFGKLAYIEVGAICVGKIVQSTDLTDFKRGDEKGYFLFGGSTVIVVGEQGKWLPSDDILEHTKRGMETYLHLGSPVGKKITKM